MARELLNLRSAHFERNRQLEAVISAIESDAEAERATVQETIARIQDIEQELEERQRNFITRVIGIAKIQSLRDELEVALDKISIVESEVRETKEALAELKNQKQNRQDLEGAKDRIGQFYAEKGQEYEEYLEDDRVNSDLSKVAREKDVVFIHGTSVVSVLQSNSLLREGVDWQTKMKILLAFNPTISSSSIGSGREIERSWAPVGFVLKGGKIKDATPGDAATVATGINSRTQDRQIGQRIGPKIEKALAPLGGYNEFVVEQPQYAAIYVSPSHRDHRTPWPKDVINMASALGLPFLLAEGGEFYEAVVEESQYILDGIKITQGRKVEAQEIAASDYEVSQSQKEQLTAEVLEQNPFRVENRPEIRQVAAYWRGKSNYDSINGRALYARAKEVNSSDFPKGDFAVQSFIERCPGVRMIGRAKCLGGEMTVLVGEEGTVAECSYDENLGQTQMYYPQASFDMGHFSYAPGVITGSESGWVDGSNYLDVTEQTLVKYSTFESIESYDMKEETKKLAYNLFGYGDEAAEHGDIETQKKAYEIASKYIPADQFREVMERRIGPDGRLVITKEDIE